MRRSERESETHRCATQVTNMNLNELLHWSKKSRGQVSLTTCSKYPLYHKDITPSTYFPPCLDDPASSNPEQTLSREHQSQNQRNTMDEPYQNIALVPKSTECLLRKKKAEKIHFESIKLVKKNYKAKHKTFTFQKKVPQFFYKPSIDQKN